MTKITQLHHALISRHDITLEEASNMIKAMHDEVISGRDPEDILYDEGLKADYVFDLLY